MGLNPGAVSVKQEYPTLESYLAAAEKAAGEKVYAADFRIYYQTSYDPAVAVEAVRQYAENNRQDTELWYIAGMGSVCYDETGVTFPIKTAVDFEAILAANRCKIEVWEQQFGWNNQPPVLVFCVTQRDSEEVSALLYDFGLMVRSHWGESPMKSEICEV